MKEKILKKQVKIAVIGLGYVGLPLAVEFAKAGFKVLGIDVDKDRVGRIKRLESYILDVPKKELVKVLKNNKLSVTSDCSLLKEADVIFICVPTPLKRRYQPNISYIKNAVNCVARNMKRNTLVVLESTTYPGTTREVILPILERSSLKHGKDFYLCFSPERIDPGNVKFPVNKITKIVGGISKEAGYLGKLIYESIIDRVVLVSSSEVAETAKLLENTFRIVNIGLIDEMAMMAHEMKFDIWEVIEAAKTKPFGFMPFYPGPGVGGHCIPKDPLYLYWKAKLHGFKSRFIKLASEVISNMPNYIVDRIEKILEDKNKKINKSKILIIGVTYKKDVKDLRKSPALDIIEILQKNKINVAYYDPLIPYLKLNHIDLKSINLNKTIL
ncbi:MAG: nucleotide sugar dehydrogenase, partial [Candidatus Omnitrophota bacterium]